MLQPAGVVTEGPQVFKCSSTATDQLKATEDEHFARHQHEHGADGRPWRPLDFNADEHTDLNVLSDVENVSPPGCRCCEIGCCGFSWLATCANSCKFCCCVPFMCCAPCAYERVRDACEVQQLVCLGMPTWSSLTLTLLGKTKLKTAAPPLSDDRWHVPHDDDPKIERVKNEQFSAVMGTDWWTACGDYDTPNFHLPWYLTAYLKWNNSQPIRPPQSDRKFTKQEWRATLKHLIGMGPGGVDARGTLVQPNTPAGVLRFCTQGIHRVSLPV